MGNIFCQGLTKNDFHFLVQIAAPAAKNKEKIKEYAQNDPAFLKSLIEDGAVFDAIASKSRKILGISTTLYFSALLRGAVKDMEKNKTHTIERTTLHRIAVFDLKETLEFLKKEGVISYLVYLLNSFESAGNGPDKEMDLNTLKTMMKNPALSKEIRCLACQRIADICLFLIGIFPRYCTDDCLNIFSSKHEIILKRLNASLYQKGMLSEYEECGQEHYERASKMACFPELAPVMEMFSQNFHLAKKPLNYISENYMSFS